jgi:hypothetical protein
MVNHVTKPFKPLQGLKLFASCACYWRWRSHKALQTLTGIETGVLREDNTPMCLPLRRHKALQTLTGIETGRWPLKYLNSSHKALQTLTGIETGLKLRLLPNLLSVTKPFKPLQGLKLSAALSCDRVALVTKPLKPLQGLKRIINAKNIAARIWYPSQSPSNPYRD